MKLMYSTGDIGDQDAFAGIKYQLDFHRSRNWGKIDSLFRLC